MVRQEVLRHEDTGLADWSQQEIADFLQTGRNAHTAAFGGMAEVIEHSAQHMSDADARDRRLSGKPPRPAWPCRIRAQGRGRHHCEAL